MTTLAEILDVPRFSDLLLLTPNSNLDQPVKSIEITETPDIANFTSSETFLLTTAMYYKDRQHELIDLIDSLINIRCAGLGIKTGRFLTEIDPSVLDYANQKEFPILSIPSTKPLGTVLQKMNSFIYNTTTEQINYALDIQKQFSTLIINDAPVEKIISEFGDIVKCPIILLDPIKEAVATSSAWDSLAHPASFLINQLIEQHAFDKNQQKDSLLVDMGDSTKLETAIFPIKSNHYFPYYLIILTPEMIPYPVSEFAIEQALLVLSFVLLKNEKLESSEKMSKSDYFLNLIERQDTPIATQKNWLAYDTNFGIRFSEFYLVVYVSLDNTEFNDQHLKLTEEKMALTYRWLDNHISTVFPHSVIFPEKNSANLIIILQKKVSLEKIEAGLIQLNNTLTKNFPVDLIFSCGQAYHSLDTISTSLIEAKLLHDSLPNLLTQPIHFYRPKGILNLFENIQAKETEYFCKNLLKELAYPSDKSLQELRKTLKTFLNNQCEITKTANDLFIHRNTVKYRIDNCEDILGLVINSPENSLNLRLALELSEGSQ